MSKDAKKDNLRLSNGMQITFDELRELTSEDVLKFLYHWCHERKILKGNATSEMRNLAWSIRSLTNKLTATSYFNAKEVRDIAKTMDWWPSLARVRNDQYANPIDVVGIELGSKFPIVYEKRSLDKAYREIERVLLQILAHKGLLASGDIYEPVAKSAYPQRIESDIQKLADSLDRLDRSSIPRLSRLLADYYLSQRGRRRIRSAVVRIDGSNTKASPSRKEGRDIGASVLRASKSNIEARRDARIAAKLNRLAETYPECAIVHQNTKDYPAVEYTHYIERKLKAESTPVSEGDIRAGLIKTIKTKLSKMLR